MGRPEQFNLPNGATGATGEFGCQVTDETTSRTASGTGNEWESERFFMRPDSVAGQGREGLAPDSLLFRGAQQTPNSPQITPKEQPLPAPTVPRRTTQQPIDQVPPWRHSGRLPTRGKLKISQIRVIEARLTRLAPVGGSRPAIHFESHLQNRNARTSACSATTPHPSPRLFDASPTQR